jgi:hypothetical protein
MRENTKMAFATGFDFSLHLSFEGSGSKEENTVIQPSVDQHVAKQMAWPGAEKILFCNRCPELNWRKT